MRKRTTNKSRPKKRQQRVINNRRGDNIRGVPQIMPRSFDTHLTFLDTTHTSINNPGTSFVALRYKANSAYDLDPLIGGTTIAGFAELSALYVYYRVIDVVFDVSMSNLETGTAVSAVILPFNLDPGATPGSVLESWFMNPYARTHILGPRGGMDSGRLISKYSGRRVTGTPAYLFDDNYRALTTGNPVNTWYVALGLFTNSTVFSSGVSITIRIKLRVRFTELRTFTS